MRTGTLAVVAGAAAAMFAIATPPAHVGRTAAPDLFLQPHPVVVVADRPVCSLLSGSKRDAGIVGQDGSASVQVDGVVYWDFGDTLVDGGGMIPNTIGWSADTDASDCLSLKPKTIEGRVAPLLPAAPGERTVWPIGMAETAPGQVYFYYASVVPDPKYGYRVAGVGLASFDTATLTAQRLLNGALPWLDGMPEPGRVYVDDQYVYSFLAASRETWTTDTILARVPKNAMASLNDYEYWEPREGRWISGLWDAAAGSWLPSLNDIGELWRQPGLLNGMDVAYNPFLQRWLAVYNTNFMGSLNARTANAITGPWDQQDTELVNCFLFHPGLQGFPCYGASQQLAYAQDGGRTIYVSYSSSDTYQVFLHEIRLAAPVYQWTDAEGHALLLAGDAAGPKGFSRDGINFYASDIPVPGFAAIHGWLNTKNGVTNYSASSPEPAEAYQDLGIAFYAPPDATAAKATNALYAPVYRWTQGKTERYSPLDLAREGYSLQEIAFYAACPDRDGDKLTDCSESFIGTDPTKGDTDGDGLDDGFEYNTAGCNPLSYTDDGDGVPPFYEMMNHSNPCVNDTDTTDTDGDGCSDAQELGSDATLGGRRDPNNPWDFFDTPDANGVRDGVILMADIMRVLRRYGADDADGSASVNRNSPPSGPPPASSAYSPAFDRSYVEGVSPSHLGAPDGHITLFELLRVLSQYGNSCVRSGS